MILSVPRFISTPLSPPVYAIASCLPLVSGRYDDI